MKNVIWVGYSKAPPYLPVATADTAKELAWLMGTTETCVNSSWSKYLSGRYRHSRFHKVKAGSESGI